MYENIPTTKICRSTVISRLHVVTACTHLATCERFSNSIFYTGLEPDSLVITGFLSHSDVTQNYPVGTPYISDPFLTMAQTSREIARRFTEVGGPSFFISFLGQESLSDVIEVNVTLDGSLDWSAALPELAYWDIGEGCGHVIDEGV